MKKSDQSEIEKLEEANYNQFFEIENLRDELEMNRFQTETLEADKLELIQIVENVTSQLNI